MDSVEHWMTTGFGDLVGFVPKLIGGLVVLLVGYVIAVVLRRVAQPLLNRLGLDRLVARLGITDVSDPQAGSRTAAYAVFTVVLIATFMQAARVFELAFVANGLAAVLAYLPHVLGAAVIFGAALFFGNFVRERMLKSDAAETTVEPVTGRGDHRVIASAVRAGILALGAFMALRELQIAAEIVTIGFALVLGAIALATALAFGLGSRDVAGRVARDWYDQRPRRNGAGKDVVPSDEWRSDPRRRELVGAYGR